MQSNLPCTAPKACVNLSLRHSSPALTHSSSTSCRRSQRIGLRRCWQLCSRRARQATLPRRCGSRLHCWCGGRSVHTITTASSRPPTSGNFSRSSGCSTASTLTSRSSPPPSCARPSTSTAQPRRLTCATHNTSMHRIASARRSRSVRFTMRCLPNRMVDASRWYDRRCAGITDADTRGTVLEGELACTL